MDMREKCQPHLWLLTGTGEGHVFAKSLVEAGWKITVSVVSERASIPYRNLILEELLVGALVDEKEIKNVILNARKNKKGFHCVVDLTHPFATEITPKISKVCKELNQECIRYERPINDILNAFLIDSFSDLKNFKLKNKSILFALGSRNLQEYVVFARDLGANVYARVLANPESIKKTLSTSIPKTNFAVLNPSSKCDGKIEKALIRKWAIKGVICRQSGGKTEQLWYQICISMGVDLWLIKRPPKLEDLNIIDNYEKLIKRLKSIRM